MRLSSYPQPEIDRERESNRERERERKRERKKKHGDIQAQEKVDNTKTDRHTETDRGETQRDCKKQRERQ